MDALTANGTTTLQTSVTGVTAGKRKFIDDRRDQPFDKRLRFSVRQTESAYRYRDIVVRKQDGFTHILLSTKSSENNSLNPEVSAAAGATGATGATVSGPAGQAPAPLGPTPPPARPGPGPATNWEVQGALSTHLLAKSPSSAQVGGWASLESRVRCVLPELSVQVWLRPPGVQPCRSSPHLPSLQPPAPHGVALQLR